MKIYRKPHRVKKRKSIFKNFFFWLIISIFFLSFIFSYLFFFSPIFQVKEIEIFGNQNVPQKELFDLIDKEIEQELFFFPTRSIFLVDLQKIKMTILEEFPEIARVNFKKKLPNSLLVGIEEREVKAIFNQGEKFFFLDSEGVIFREIPEIKGNLLVIKTHFSHPPLHLAKKVIEKELLNKILEINSKLKDNLKISIKETILFWPEKLDFITFEGWSIYLDSQKDLNWQLTKLNAVLEKEIPLERRKDLEYIDLRFGNLASYKYRQ